MEPQQVDENLQRFGEIKSSYKSKKNASGRTLCTEGDTTVPANRRQTDTDKIYWTRPTLTTRTRRTTTGTRKTRIPMTTAITTVNKPETNTETVTDTY